MGNKRCARKTLAYSKSWDNPALTASIHMFVYNLVRRHETTKTTPASIPVMCGRGRRYVLKPSLCHHGGWGTVQEPRQSRSAPISGSGSTGRCKITTDGHGAYRWAIGANFNAVDYAQLVKIYGKDEKGFDTVVGIRKEPVFGTPDIELVSTSYVERANLTIRMGNRRFTRLTNGFSKKLENHCHMLAIQMMNYNFCMKHGTIKTAPAHEAGVTNHRWKLEEVIEMTDRFTAERDRLAFERAFESKFSAPRSSPKTYAPVAPRTPWYLDVNSGGKPTDENP